MDSFPFGNYTEGRYNSDTWYGQNNGNFIDNPPLSAISYPGEYQGPKSTQQQSWSTAPSPYLPSSNSMWPSGEQGQVNPQEIFSGQQLDISRQNSMGSEATAVDPNDQFLTANHHQSKYNVTSLSPSLLSNSPPVPSIEHPHFQSTPSANSIHMFSPDMCSSAMPSPALPSASLDEINALGLSNHHIIPTTELGHHQSLHHQGNGHSRSKSSSSSATPASSRSNTTSSMASSRSSMSIHSLGRQGSGDDALFNFPKDAFAPPPSNFMHTTPPLGPALPGQPPSSMPQNGPPVSISLTCPQPVKRRRGRPRILRSPSDPMEGGVYAPRQNMSSARQSRRQPHNMVERKYREGLNKEMERLRNALPQLAGTKRTRRVREDGEEYSEDEEDDDDKSIQKASKAVVLQSAVEEIENLRRDKKRLEDRVIILEREVAELRGEVKMESS